MTNQKLIDYIKNCLSERKPKEEIYKELLNSGWTIEAIQEGFNSIKSEFKPKEEEREKEDSHRKIVSIVVIIASVLVGAGIFSFIAANWQEMAKALKVLIIVVSMILSYIAGWYLKEKLKYSKTGEAFILLGSIIYGAGIFLIAQIFNIRANWPDGFILWMIGVIIMAYAVDSFLLFYLAIPLGTIALVGYPFGIFTNFSRYDPFLLTSSLLLLIAMIITFFAGLFMRKKIPIEKLKKLH